MRPVIKSRMEKYPHPGLEVYIQYGDIEVTVPTEYLVKFGYMSVGCELGIIRDDNYTPVVGDEFNDIVFEILFKEIKSNRALPDAVTQMYWMKQYPHKTKVMKDASMRIFSFLKDNYQELFRYHNSNK